VSASERLPHAVADALLAAIPLDLRAMRAELEASGGGIEASHIAAALEIRVEVLNSPGPGTMRTEWRDALYVVLDGSGLLGVVNSDPLSLTLGDAAVVPAGARHVIFGNPRLSLLVVLGPGWKPVAPLALCRRS
jgi:mannose-6-phosphate isomerase-like protein (cupin superfamily)